MNTWTYVSVEIRKETLLGHHSSEPLGVLLNIRCHVGGVGTKAFSAVVFTETHS